MAEIEEAIHSILSAHVGLSALISDRSYPVRAQEEPTTPYVVYREVAESNAESHDGLGLSFPRFQFSCYDTDSILARDVRTQVKGALHGFKGTVLGVEIQGANKAGQQYFWDEESQLYRAIIDLRIAWREFC